jgi:hypothetical protein
VFNEISYKARVAFNKAGSIVVALYRKSSVFSVISTAEETRRSSDELYPYIFSLELMIAI